MPETKQHPANAILIVDDDEDVLTAARLLLKRHYPQVDVCADPKQVLPLMERRDYAAILLDMNFGPGESTGAQGFYWLEQILQANADAVVVMITAHGDIDKAVDAIKIGATDYVTKPWQNEKLVATLSAGVKLHQTRYKSQQLQNTNDALREMTSAGGQQMLGASPAMQAVQTLIQKAAPTQANVLIVGENGTGKELAARALHHLSDRSEQAFIAIDLGAIAETLFEAELFGATKGAYTNATKDRIGRIQACDGGTLFLDEVGNLPLHLQTKLLSVLEQKQVIPVGAVKPINVDIRIIAATNLARDKLNNEQHFRQDLLFRLNTVEIEIPPLRARKEDIKEIAQHYAALYAKKYDRPSKSFSVPALEAITDYHWPGNVRALRHALERAVILSEDSLFHPADFNLTATPNVSQPSSRPAGSDLNLESLEKDAIQRSLNLHRYNISHSAKALGLTRSALYRRMEKYGL